MKKVTPGQILGLATVLANNVDWTKLDGSVIQDLITDPTGTGKKGTEWLANNANMQLVVITGNIVDLDDDPYIPRGLALAKNDDGTLCHKKGGQFKYDPTKVVLYLDEDQKNGKNIVGHKLRKNLVNQDVFNANLLDFYMAHQELIPESWKGQYVFFWGTIYRDTDSNFCVRCLCWEDDWWYAGHDKLGNDWCLNTPSVVLSK